MKRLCTWAWSDPVAVSKRVNRSAFGGGYWKWKQVRRHEAAQIRAIRSLRLVPVVSVNVSQDAASEAPPAPVVH